MVLANSLKFYIIRTAGSALLALLAAGFYVGITPAHTASAASHESAGEFTLDVLSDARTAVLNHRDPAQATSDPTDFEDFGRGDTFILEGVIYPGGTLPEGQDSRLPEDFTGAIGRWVCQGVFNVSAAQAFGQGLSPHVYATQYFFLDDGRTYVTEGPEGGGAFLRAVVGGMGLAAGASGQQMDAEIGVNGTGLQNFRSQFAIEQPAAQLAEIEAALDDNTTVIAAIQNLLNRIARALSLNP